MRNNLVIKSIFLVSILFLPSMAHCLDIDGGMNFDMGFKLLAGISIIIILGAFMSIVNLGMMLINLEKERSGITQKVLSKKSYWDIFMDKVTGLKPLEQEQDILLHHDYDGIQELNNNLPPWWLYGFYVSIVFAVFYLGYFHYSEYGMSSGEEYQYEVEQAEIAVAKFVERQANTIDESNLELLMDEESLAQGKAVFKNNCVACHLDHGGGSPISIGPNLTDKYWVHGGDIASVFKTIKYGVPAKGMIAWKAQLNPADMHRVASYILSLQGTNPPNAKAQEGELYVSEE